MKRFIGFDKLVALATIPIAVSLIVVEYEEQYGIQSR